MGFSSAQQQRDDVIWMPLANQEFEEREVSKYKNKWTQGFTLAIRDLHATCIE